MNTKLNHIQNWPELARQAKWSVTAFAKLCGVSVRTLERHFYETRGQKPKVWLAEQRQRQALGVLRDGSSVKETAAQMGYKQTSHFSQDFKTHWGFCPTQLNSSG